MKYLVLALCLVACGTEEEERRRFAQVAYENSYGDQVGCQFPNLNRVTPESLEGFSISESALTRAMIDEGDGWFRLQCFNNQLQAWEFNLVFRITAEGKMINVREEGKVLPHDTF